MPSTWASGTSVDVLVDRDLPVFGSYIISWILEHRISRFPGLGFPSPSTWSIPGPVMAIPSSERCHARAIRDEGRPSDLHLVLQYFGGVLVSVGGGFLRCDGVARDEVCRPHEWQ